MYNFKETIESIRAISKGEHDRYPLQVERSLDDIKGPELTIFTGYASNLTFHSLGVNVVDDSERAGYLIAAYSDYIKAVREDNQVWEADLTATFKWEADDKVTITGKTAAPKYIQTGVDGDDEPIYGHETIETTIEFTDATSVVVTSDAYGYFKATSATPQTAGLVKVTDANGGIGTLNTACVTIDKIEGNKLNGKRFTASVEFSKELIASQNKDAEVKALIMAAVDREITKYVIEKTLAKAQTVTAPTLGVPGLCDIEEKVKTSGIYITDPATFKAGKQLGVSGGYLFKGGKSQGIAYDGQPLFTPSVENLPTGFGQKVLFGDPSQITVALYGTFISVDQFTYQRQGKLVLTIDTWAEVGLTSDKAWAVADITG
jgi:hypothetical protein